MMLSCPLGTTLCVTQEKFPCEPDDKSFIHQACLVKIHVAGNRPFYSGVLSYLAMNASKAGGDLALVQTSFLFSLIQTAFLMQSPAS